MMGPRVLGLFFVQMHFLVNTILASHLVVGSISALNYAWLLMLLPLGIFSQSVATAAFPTFAAQIAGGILDVADVGRPHVLAQAQRHAQAFEEAVAQGMQIAEDGRGVVPVAGAADVASEPATGGLAAPAAGATPVAGRPWAEAPGACEPLAHAEATSSARPSTRMIPAARKLFAVLRAVRPLVRLICPVTFPF